MSAPDELVEMWTAHDVRTTPALKIADRLNDADRVIATERRLNSEAIAARDARIAEWIAKHDAELFGRASDNYKSAMAINNYRVLLDASNAALASRDAEIGRLREALEAIKAFDPGDFRPLADEIKIHQIATAALTPPSQAPEARRDVGGEKL